jgi:hypothetical protein
VACIEQAILVAENSASELVVENLRASGKPIGCCC